MTTIGIIGGATGREHCLVTALSRIGRVVAALWDEHEPIRRIAHRYAVVDLRSPEKVIQTVSRWSPDFVVVGQAEALYQGIGDRLAALGIPCVGPSRMLARIESSKEFSRQLVQELDPQWAPRWKSFSAVDAALVAFVNGLEGGVVVKAAGPVRNPRVRVFRPGENKIEQVAKTAAEFLAKAGGIVVEEFIDGQEVALTSFFDCSGVLHSPPFHNYKHLLPGDEGPLTSGMAAVASADLLDTVMKQRLAAINEAVVRRLEHLSDERFIGCLYGEFRITPEGTPKVVEFNCRLGNPSTINLAALSVNGIESILEATATGSLGLVDWRWERDWSLSAYVVPSGFLFSTHAVGSRIDFQECSTNRLFVGKLSYRDGYFRLRNSRAVAISARAPSIDDARATLYRELARVRGPVEYRDDVGVLDPVQAL